MGRKSEGGFAAVAGFWEFFPTTPKFDGMNKLDFHTYTTMRNRTRRVDPDDRPAQDIDLFYGRVMNDAVSLRSAQFLAQMVNERDWEKGKRPFYNVWRSCIITHGLCFSCYGTIILFPFLTGDRRWRRKPQ
jgi:hypothetical protein